MVASFARHPEAADAGQREQVAPVAGLGELGDPPGAADAVQLGFNGEAPPSASGWIMPMTRSVRRASSTIAR